MIDTAFSARTACAPGKADCVKKPVLKLRNIAHTKFDIVTKV